MSLLLSILAFNSLILSSQAYEKQEHQLRVSTSIRSNLLFPIQTFPITVSFKIENIGNSTFDGKVTLELKTKEGYYSPKEFQVTDLGKDEVYKNSCSYATDHEGRYWATLEIEASDLSRIALYSRSILEQNASRVKYTDSIYLYSLGISVAIFVALVTVVSVMIAYLKYRKE